eukprot:7380485-Prymnesium_polylepis.1
MLFCRSLSAASFGLALSSASSFSRSLRAAIAARWLATSAPAGAPPIAPEPTPQQDGANRSAAPARATSACLALGRLDPRGKFELPTVDGLPVYYLKR